MFFNHGITPQFLQLVKAAKRFQENMNYCINIIEQDPF